jgi:hypothetical protein
MRQSAEDFATLSEQHLIAANHAASRGRREMHLEIAHHYARIAALKERRTNVVELYRRGAGDNDRV